MQSETDLYLPIEIKGRELAASVFLATRALSRGFAPYIGSRDAIYQHVVRRKKRNAILLYKSNLPLRSKKKYIKYVQNICVLDQEVGPVINDYYSSIDARLIDGVEFIDRWFTIGPRAQEAAEKHFGSNAVETGWPRLDLCNLARRGEYFPSSISTLGLEPYVLFASNWGNSQHLLDEIASWDEYSETLNIVVRPHVGEPLAPWIKIVGNQSRVHIATEGDPHAWIRRSLAVVHTGSTVGIEALIMGKRSYLVTPENAKIPNIYGSLSCKNLKIGVNLKEVVSLNSGNLAINPVEIKDFGELPKMEGYARNDTCFASDRICDQLADLGAVRGRVSLIDRSSGKWVALRSQSYFAGTRLLDKSRSIVQSELLANRGRRTEIVQKISGRIQTIEVIQILDELLISGEIVVEEIGPNLFALHPFEGDEQVGAHEIIAR